MEMKEHNLPPWLNKEHPNYERWKRGRELAVERGRLVQHILSLHKPVKELNVLDLGSGEGGTAFVFSGQNLTVSFDISHTRLIRQAENYGELIRVRGSANLLPFKVSSFDLIIIQDVIEHISPELQIINQLSELLKPGGLIYLSTPNKFSFLNIISDPHWGLPFVSLMNRATIKKYVLKYIRKDEYNREDIASLYSLRELLHQFNHIFEIHLKTKEIVEELFNGNKGIVWSDFHLSVIRLLKKTALNKIILNLANNKAGILNKYFTPTFYIVLKKR